MSPEDYERIKEAEKEHLRAMKKLKQQVRALKKKQRVSGSVADMARGMDSVLQTHEQALEDLALETLRNEARMEVALEQTDADALGSDTPPLEDLNEAAQKARAKALVQQLKTQMGVPVPSNKPADPATTPPAVKPSSGTTPGDLPEKTIGRMRRSS